VRRRVTKKAEGHLTAPAVILQPGWVISVDGKPETVTKVGRIDNGPQYRVETDVDTHEWGAAKKIPVVSTERPI
jgi:hypothetical protein